MFVEARTVFTILRKNCLFSQIFSLNNNKVLVSNLNHFNQEVIILNQEQT